MSKVKQYNDSIYWRYKKRSEPVEEHKHLNGPVVIVKPVSNEYKKHKLSKGSKDSSKRCTVHDYFALDVNEWNEHIVKFH